MKGDERQRQREQWAKRRAARKRDTRQGGTDPSLQQRFLEPGGMSVLKEVRYIVGRARRGEGRVVTLDRLLLLSTPNGDAWLLDTDDDLALCLALDGQEQPYQIVELSGKFAIDWPAAFAIEGDRFVVRDRSGTTTRITGYPLAEIRAAIDRVRNS